MTRFGGEIKNQLNAKCLLCCTREERKHENLYATRKYRISISLCAEKLICLLIASMILLRVILFLCAIQSIQCYVSSAIR